MDTFWSLEPPYVGRAVTLAGALEIADCPVSKEHRIARRTEPLSVEFPGKRVADIVWTWESYVLIQDRVLAIFREQGFTGFDVKPVVARWKGSKKRQPDQGEIPRLWELVTTGWGGVAPPESGIRIRRRCRGCNHQEYTGFRDPSRLVDAAQWDGSDLFMVWPLPMYRFMSDRMAKCIVREKLTGAKLVPVDRLTDAVGGTLTPGRLREYFENGRAQEIGLPLGIY